MQQLKPKLGVNSKKPYKTFSEKRKFKQEINQRIVSIITGGFMIYFIQNISKIVLFLDEQGRNDNVTLKSCSSFIMYNRVNKCGSTTLQSLIDIVGKLLIIIITITNEWIIFTSSEEWRLIPIRSVLSEQCCESIFVENALENTFPRLKASIFMIETNVSR